MTSTATAAAEELFRAVAPEYMRLFMQDFSASDLDAAAVFGNFGYECLGFTKLQEIKPTVAGSRGGYGWAQWTGDRRHTFEAYCKRNDLDPSTPLANYKFLFVELIGTEKGALAKLKAAKTLGEKVIAFEAAYERAGVKAYPKRQQWAAIALDALHQSELPEAEPAAPASVPEPVPSAPMQVSAPSWLPLVAIAVLAALVGLWVWFSGHPVDLATNSVIVPEGAPVPHDRPAQLFGAVSQPSSVWSEIGFQILMSFIAPLVSAAATAAVSWVVYMWGKVLKSDFDKKSADSLHAALERGILAAIELLGSTARRQHLLASAADYAQTWNSGTVKRLGLTSSDLEQLAAPHLAAVKRGAK